MCMPRLGSWFDQENVERYWIERVYKRYLKLLYHPDHALRHDLDHLDYGRDTISQKYSEKLKNQSTLYIRRRLHVK